MSFRPATVLSGTRGFLLSVSLASVAAISAWVVRPTAPTRPLFVLFGLPVLLCALVAGLGPALVATVLLAILSAPFAVPILHRPAAFAGADPREWLLSVLAGLAVAGLIEAERRRRRAA